MAPNDKLLLTIYADMKDRLVRLEAEVMMTRVDIAGLKVKASVWGGITGLVGGVLAALLGGLSG